MQFKTKRTVGFTLVEMMACLFIMGLIAAAATLSLGGAQRVTEVHDLLERIGEYDAQWREHCRRFGRPACMVIDMQEQSLSIHENAPDTGNKRLFGLPHGYRCSAVLTPAGRVDQDQVGMVCSTLGITNDYALRVEYQGGRHVWLIVVGATGQVITDATDEQVQEASASWQNGAES